MKCFTLRASRMLRCVTKRREQQGLATLETALKSRFASRPMMSFARVLLPVAACALLGLTATADAADTPAAPLEKAAADVSATALASARNGEVTRSVTPTKIVRRANLNGSVTRLLVAAHPKPVAAQEEKPAEEVPEGPKPGEVTVSGLLDWYFGYNARAPRAPGGGRYDTSIITPSGETLARDNYGLFFNGTDRQPGFNLGEINITRTPSPSFPLGVTATLTFGDAARLFHATEPGGTSSYSMLHNLYVTKTFSVLNRDVAVDFGKFASPFGTEVLEATANDNYSRAFTFWYGVPFYHLGLRATTNLTPKITFQAGLVNGWNDVADSNDAKTLYAQFVLKPNPRFTQVIGFIGGSEGTGAYGSAVPTDGGGNITTNLLDLQSIYQITDKTKIAGWLAYGSAAGDVNGVHLSGNWLGMVAYVKHQFSPQFAVAGRLEQFEDIPGVGGLGPRALANTLYGGVGGYRKWRGATLTFEYTTLRGHLVSRLEFRHDHSNARDFGTASGGGSWDQDTVYFSQIYRF